jgi:hypothetical protein
MNQELVAVVVPNNIQSMMSGVQMARIKASGSTQLVYVDGTSETAKLSESELTRGRENFFALVSAVQAKRNT